jgi:hypothetical protein
MRVTTPIKRRAVVRGEYNRNGYEVRSDGQHVYSAGNHVQDSCQPTLCKEDRLPLKTIRRFCIKTAREIATEHRGRFAGVERVTEDQSNLSPSPCKFRRTSPSEAAPQRQWLSSSTRTSTRS